MSRPELSQGAEVIAHKHRVSEDCRSNPLNNNPGNSISESQEFLPLLYPSNREADTEVNEREKISRLIAQQLKVSKIGQKLSDHRKDRGAKWTQACDQSSQFLDKTHHVFASSEELVKELRKMTGNAAREPRIELSESCQLHQLMQQLSNDMACLTKQLSEIFKLKSYISYHEQAVDEFEKKWTKTNREYLELLSSITRSDWTAVLPMADENVPKPIPSAQRIPECAQIYFNIKGQCRLLEDQMNDARYEREQESSKREFLEDQGRSLEPRVVFEARHRAGSDRLRSDYDRQMKRLELWESACRDQGINLSALRRRDVVDGSAVAEGDPGTSVSKE